MGTQAEIALLALTLGVAAIYRAPGLLAGFLWAALQPAPVANT